MDASVFMSTPRPPAQSFRDLALSIIAEKTQAGYSHVVDVDLKSYFDTISHELLLDPSSTLCRAKFPYLLD